MSLLPRDAPDLHGVRWPSRRSAVLGRGAMVATSQPLAAQAGLHVLRDGGNAYDAAVATAAVLAVIEPTGTGLGGDCFALLRDAATGEVRALNGSGRSPMGLARDELVSLAGGAMPERGVHAITVPGAVDAWARLLDECGRMTLSEVLTPAISLAEEGYPVSELIAGAWRASETLLSGQDAARRHFLPGGRAPLAGEIVRLPAMARSLRLVADGGRDAFYRGPLAAAVVATSDEEGGRLSLDDFERHESTWDMPLSVEFGPARVWECPPNGQGLAALVAMAIARGLDVGAAKWGSGEHMHPLIESMRLGFAEAHAWIGDPTHASSIAPEGAPLETLLSDAYASRRRATIRPDKAITGISTGVAAGTDTVYLAVVDGEGNACSFIASNFMGFGSGLVAGDTGIPLQNRGAGFTLEPDHVNSYAPGKRPYHTIIPGLATRVADDSLLAVFGVMGGHMQPQGHLQVLANVFEFGMDPQRALDAPRFQVTADDRVALEPWFDDELRRDLAARGHDLVPVAETPSAGYFGGGQVIAVTDEGVRVGGSDPRKDGQAVAAD